MAKNPEIYFVKDGVTIDSYSFGKVPSGKTITTSIEVHNSGDYELIDVEFSLSHPDVKIISSPKSIYANNFGLLVLEYSPTEDSEGLKNLEIKVSAKYEK